MVLFLGGFPFCVLGILGVDRSPDDPIARSMCYPCTMHLVLSSKPSLTLCSLGRLSPAMLCSTLTFRARYNATSPPIYNLSAFGANHTKLVVYQGSDDHLADPEDVQVRAKTVAHPPFLCGVATLSEAAPHICPAKSTSPEAPSCSAHPLASHTVIVACPVRYAGHP